MSEDIKIQNKCDHLINWEAGILRDDRKSIDLKYPIGAVASVVLRIDNVVIDAQDYDVVTREEFRVVEPPFFIRMKSRIDNFEPLIEVLYTTVLKYCPKCNGIRVLDDLVYTASGDFKMVEREFLLIQGVEKYIITRVGSNIFHDWMGTDLHNIIGSKIFDLEILRTRIVGQVHSAIDKLKNVQQQLQATNRKLTDGELFGELISVQVEPTDDPTLVAITVVFTSQSGRTLEFSQFLELSEFRERRALG